MTSKSNFERNVRARLEALGRSACRASVRTNRRPAWLTDSLGRTTKGVNLDMGDEIGDLLCCPLPALLADNFDPHGYPAPQWALDDDEEEADEEEAE